MYVSPISLSILDMLAYVTVTIAMTHCKVTINIVHGSGMQLPKVKRTIC